MVVKSRELVLRDGTPEEAIKSWLAANQEMQNTGVVGPYLTLSTRGCKFCTEFAETVRATYEAGGSARVPEIELRSIRLEHINGAAYYAAKVRLAPSEVTAREGATPRTFEGGSVTYLFRMALKGDGWRVDDVLEKAS